MRRAPSQIAEEAGRVDRYTGFGKRQESFATPLQAAHGQRGRATPNLNWAVDEICTKGRCLRKFAVSFLFFQRCTAQHARETDIYSRRSRKVGWWHGGSTARNQGCSLALRPPTAAVDCACGSGDTEQTLHAIERAKAGQLRGGTERRHATAATCLEGQYCSVLYPSGTYQLPAPDTQRLHVTELNWTERRWHSQLAAARGSQVQAVWGRRYETLNWRAVARVAKLIARSHIAALFPNQQPYTPNCSFPLAACDDSKFERRQIPPCCLCPLPPCFKTTAVRQLATCDSKASHTCSNL